MSIDRIAMFAKWLGKMASYIWPDSIRRKIGHFKDFVHTGYVQRNFKQFGEGSIVSRGASFTGAGNVSVGMGCRIGKGCRIVALTDECGGQRTPEIVIGNHCVIGQNGFITSMDNITIGDGCLIGASVLITDNAHGNNTPEEASMSPATRPLYSKGPVSIGKNVWVGERVTILPGVSIGEGSVIGANAVVTKSVPPYSVVAGIPAKVVRTIISPEISQ